MSLDVKSSSTPMVDGVLTVEALSLERYHKIYKVQKSDSYRITPKSIVRLRTLLVGSLSRLLRLDFADVL